MHRWFRRGAAVAAAALLLGLAASLALGNAALLDGKLRAGDTVTVPAGETWHGDIYLLAGRVSVEGTVEGDVTAFGGQVDISGKVNGDVLAAGGNVSVSGTVDGDVRIAAGQLNLAGAIGEDVAATGGQVTVPSGAKIGGDLIVAGGQIAVAGSVAGSIEGSAGSYSRSGSVGGTEHVVISERAPAVAAARDVVFDALRQLVVVVLIGALALWLLPRTVAATERILRERPLLALGVGILACLGYIAFVVGVFIAIILLGLMFGLLQIGSLAAIEGAAGFLALGVVSLVFVLVVAFLVDALIGLTAARMAMRMALRSRWQELGLLVVGAAAVVIVTSIPVISGWAKLAVVLFGLGALTVAAWEAWRGRAKTAGEPAA